MNWKKIQSTLETYLRDSNFELFLHGSRIDDELKGGDIDLFWVIPDDQYKSIVKKKLYIASELSLKLNEQKVDLTLVKESDHRNHEFFNNSIKLKSLLDSDQQCIKIFAKQFLNAILRNLFMKILLQALAFVFLVVSGLFPKQDYAYSEPSQYEPPTQCDSCYDKWSKATVCGGEWICECQKEDRNGVMKDVVLGPFKTEPKCKEISYFVCEDPKRLTSLDPLCEKALELAMQNLKDTFHGAFPGPFAIGCNVQDCQNGNDLVIETPEENCCSQTILRSCPKK